MLCKFAGFGLPGYAQKALVINQSGLTRINCFLGNDNSSLHWSFLSQFFIVILESYSIFSYSYPNSSDIIVLKEVTTGIQSRGSVCVIYLAGLLSVSTAQYQTIRKDPEFE